MKIKSNGVEYTETEEINKNFESGAEHKIVENITEESKNKV